ncbi:2-methoxy-6-polyprenyl-1,4-benzoquinol methylase, mitochondrial isoform X1 [Schistocerca gregaria]|uniref:2-methoxy-6-polyprenyl-1,4-benzoquinol methylase, mitochondrial isoform X1 n=1 Tax=Schistocerca gregaria TaxID=7010 RepID=UPI00211DF3B0|nr:2-methoxy-6-polyprenyl-1,4-benzoquinol methylase, mitochondrial isoform X1 [Schistocerca gregaria]
MFTSSRFVVGSETAVCGLKMAAFKFSKTLHNILPCSRRCLMLSCVKNSPVYAQNKDSNENETHFGFERVKESEKAEKVHHVFEAVATSYDKMNDAMSFGVHRLWKDIFIYRLSPTPRTRLLDVAGGTGDIAFRYLRYIDNLKKRFPTVDDEAGHVTVCDINSAMLDVGKRRAELSNLSPDRISWLCGDAENLPVEDCSYNAYTIAFGIRNCTHIDKVVREAYRVLKPGGRFLCLEFSHVNNSLLQWAYDQYSFQVIPVMGQLIAGQWKPYQYLVESIRQFPSQDAFKTIIENAGFSCVTYENLTFGVVAIHSGFKT